MKKPLLWALCLIIIGAFSCRKSIENVDPNSNCLQVSYVSTTDTDGSVWTATYEYDAQKRRINRKVRYTYLESGITKIYYTSLEKYVYSDLKIVVIGEGDSGGTAFSNQFYYDLNKDGYVINAKKVYVNSTNYTTYTYDAGGYLIEEKNNDGTTINYTYGDGNLLLSIKKTSTYTEATTFEYLSDKLDSPLIDYYIKTGFYGKRNKNLVKNWTTTTTYLSSSTKNVTKTEETYSFDETGKIKQIIDKYTPSSGATIISKNDYSYQCQ